MMFVVVVVVTQKINNINVLVYVWILVFIYFYTKKYNNNVPLFIQILSFKTRALACCVSFNRRFNEKQ